MEERKNNQLSIEEKYSSKSERDHIISRPGMYIGSVHGHSIDRFLFSGNKNKILLVQNVNYIAGLVKLVDEVISNTIDAYRDKHSFFKITELFIRIEKDGTITVRDNGGIPVVKHKIEDKYLTTFLFGNLRTSGNYNENVERSGVGLNGIGSKIANIFSSYFEVISADTKKQITTRWINNMELESENITDTIDTSLFPEKHGIQFKYKIELHRFGLDELDIHTIKILQQRAINAAGGTYGLKVTFQSDVEKDGVNILDGSWQFNNFMDYCKMYFENDIVGIVNHSADMFMITKNIGSHMGFVNGAECNQGTHIKKIEKSVCKEILTILKQDHNIELITEKDITSRISIFVNMNISNPEYDSQTKDTLENKIPSTKLQLTKTFITDLKNSWLIEELVDYFKVKYEAEIRKQNRKINNQLKLTKTNKLIGGTNLSSKIPQELFIFEGLSARSGFRMNRDVNSQSAYMLRGKVKNSINLDNQNIFENQELRELVAVLKLQFGEEKANLRNCPFDKIIIATDADVDGAHIVGLLLTFFVTHFPELVKAGKIYRALSPIIIVEKKSGDSLLYYDMETYEKALKNKDFNVKTDEIFYCKGLGGLTDKHYRPFLREQKLICLTFDDLTNKNIKLWFDKSTDMRKQELLNYMENYDE